MGKTEFATTNVGNLANWINQHMEKLRLWEVLK